MTAYNINYGWPEDIRAAGVSATGGQGGLIWIWSRHQDSDPRGYWGVTLWWQGQSQSFTCVLDNFGTLVPIRRP